CFALLCQFLIESLCFRRVLSGYAVFLILVRCFPVNKGTGDVFPIISLCAVVVDAIAVNFPFRAGLVRAVFKDEAFGGGLSGEVRREREQRNCQESERQKATSHDPPSLL